MGSLIEIAKKYSDRRSRRGTDKGISHSYLEVYEKLFAEYIGKGINLMEVGVASGKSLLMWEEYFENAKIYGVDISPKPEILNGHNTIEFCCANSRDVVVMNEFAKGVEFDVIIDDGDHRINSQVRTLKVLYPRLKIGGLYIIEDVGNFDSCKRFAKWKGCVEIVDLRARKQRGDDVLIVIRKT